MNEFADAILFRFCSCQNFLSEFFIGEAEGAAERAANNSFSKAAGEVRFTLGDVRADAMEQQRRRPIRLK